MNQKKATQQVQSKIAKDKNLAKAESEMDKVKPITPYVASSYLDKEEETWLKGVASQGAWAAVNAREEKTVSGGKPLAVPAPQEPNPPDKYNDGVSTWWDVLDWDWWKSNEPWPPPFGPKWISPAMSTVTPTSTPVLVTQTTTKTLHPDEAWIIAYQTANTPLPTQTPLPTHTPQVDIDYQLGRYGISIVGNTDSATLQVALDTANLLGKNYMPFLNAPTPKSAFLRSNGQVLIILDDKATFFYQEVDRNGNTIEKVAPGNCETKKNILQNINEFNYIAQYKINIGTKDKPVYETKEVQTFAPQTIVCKQPPTEENLMHEFGHTTPNHIGFDIFSNVDKILKFDGKYLDYNEDGGYWQRDSTGFLNGNYSLEHRITIEESRTDGYAKLEQLADMLMNWHMEQAGSTQYGFTNDPAGNARREYTLSLIKEMLVGR